MLRGPQCLTPWVDLRCHQYPENGLLAGLGWGFHPKITIWSQQKAGVAKLFFIYVKRAKAKNNVISYPGVPLTATQKQAIQKMGNTIDINLYESAKAKKQCHGLPNSVLWIWHDQCKYGRCSHCAQLFSRHTIHCSLIFYHTSIGSRSDVIQLHCIASCFLISYF